MPFTVLFIFVSCSKTNPSTTTPTTKNNAWCKITKATTVLNGSQSISTYTWNGNTYTGKDASSGIKEDVATYNDNGKILSYTYYNSDGSILYSYATEYTDCANWCKATKRTDNTTTPPVVTNITWNGNTSTEKNTAGQTTTVTTYNDNGKVLSQTTYNPTTGAVNGTTTYEYTDCANWCKVTKQTTVQGTTSTVLNSTWSGNTQTNKDGTGLLKSVQIYNDFGEIISQTVYNSDGSIGLTLTNEYTDCKQ